MWYFSRNMRTLSGIIAVALFIASSGFTTIVHNCTMDVIAACCEGEESKNHEDCYSTSTAKELAIDSPFACHTNTLVGGVSTNPAVLEKENKPDLKKASIAPILSTLAVVESERFNHTTSRFIVPAEPVYLLSGEKYVLFAAFLI